MLPLIRQHVVDRHFSSRGIQWTIKKYKTLGQFCESLYFFVFLLRDHIGHGHRHNQISTTHDNRGYLTAHLMSPLPTQAPPPENQCMSPFQMYTPWGPWGRPRCHRPSPHTTQLHALYLPSSQHVPCLHWRSSPSCMAHCQFHSWPRESWSQVLAMVHPGTMAWPVWTVLAVVAWSLTMRPLVGVVVSQWHDLLDELQSS